MNYYSNASNSNRNDETKQKLYFLSLFKNLRYYDSKGLLITSLDYSSIENDNLYKYYENNDFINKKSEPSIIETFMSKYSTLSNTIEATIGDHVGILSINDESLKVSESTNVVENFQVNRIDNYHPQTPDIISASSSSDYDTSVFNDAFQYDLNGTYTDLNSYLRSTYNNGSYTSGKTSCKNSTGGDLNS